MQGRLVEHPSAELIREIFSKGLSGGLRLARERAKAAIYFENGQVIFASSNLRAHRLHEIIRHRKLIDGRLDEGLTKATDDELAAALIQSGRLTAKTLDTIRADQVLDVVRLVLLWTSGTFEFDPRVRPMEETRVEIDLNGLLLECARRLPEDFARSRLAETNGNYLTVVDNAGANHLLPAEAFVLSRAEDKLTLSELIALSGMGEAEALRTIYALSLSGHLERSDWPTTFFPGRPAPAKKADTITAPSPPLTAEELEAEDLQDLFARLESARNSYEVLGVGPSASIDEMKNVYHALARRFHPDRFHQEQPDLRRRIDSAFAQIAQAYETLRDPSLRSDHDARRPGNVPAASRQDAVETPKEANSGPQATPGPKPVGAANCFRQGQEALRENRREEAIRLMAEAAKLEPRVARYRAHYGYALIKNSNTRRAAERELQAALSLDPENVSYRVMLAELYKALGLRRRAEGELERALAVDPKNEAARSLLLSLKSK
jgi:curved DNA-binding protein CbpA